MGSPWLELSGPSAEWTKPYEEAGVDPWKMTRKDGYAWFNPWLEMGEVPLADKLDYVEAYNGPKNPQIDYWSRYLVSDETEGELMKRIFGAQLSDRERNRLIHMFNDKED
jgi:hypothetical protein